MSKADIDNIIADVFAITGTKLTADDPIVAVLLLQQKAISDFEQRQNHARDKFLTELAKHEENITQAAAELQTYRQQILTELLQKTDQQQEDVEARLFSSINQRITVNTERQQQMFFNRLKNYLLAAVVACFTGLALLAAVMLWQG